MRENPINKLPQTEASRQLADVSKQEFEAMFAAMQTAQHHRGAEQSFALPGEVLGAIALKHMNRNP